MGSAIYKYVVEYKNDINEALKELREREFQAGRYNPVIKFPFDLFPIGAHSPSPGAQHKTMAEAYLTTGADGTRSIIDIECVSDRPGFRRAVLLGDDVLREVFGASKPTRAMVEAKGAMLFYEIENHCRLRRGEAIFFILYKDNLPDEIYFAGRSID